MNTKQVEELVGLSRQNIRYYEKAGLLTPVREQQNSYRAYSQEDIKRLRIIKMLRMLDMPIKEIERVLNHEISIQEAAAVRQRELLELQKQLQAAIDICGQLKKEKSQVIPVQKYLDKMEHMEKTGNVFAKIIDDYKQIVHEQKENSITFYTEQNIHTAADFEKILREYARVQGYKFKIREKGKKPEFYFNDDLYCAVYSFEKPDYRIVCMRVADTEKKNTRIKTAYTRLLIGIHSISSNIKRHYVKSICGFLISFLLVFLWGIYLGNLEQVNSQIADLSESIPVFGTIYNSSGKFNNHLLIKEDFIEGIRQSEYVDQINETVELSARDESGENLRILAAEDGQLDGLQHGQCMASPVFLKNHDLKIGDKLVLPIYCYMADIMSGRLTEYLLAEVEVEIVGSREMEEPILLPLNYAKELFEQAGVDYQASSLSFCVSVPEKLNAFKTEMKELGLTPIQSGAKENYYGTALGIEDATFIQASIKLENNKMLFQSFLPIVILLLLIAEYLISYLLLQSRRQEFAIMRALGKSQSECRRGFLTEQLVLNFAGTITGSIACMSLIGLKIHIALIMSIIFLFITVLGVYSAVWMLGRFHVAAVLTRRD